MTEHLILQGLGLCNLHTLLGRFDIRHVLLLLIE